MTKLTYIPAKNITKQYTSSLILPIWLNIWTYCKYYKICVHYQIDAKHTCTCIRVKQCKYFETFAPNVWTMTGKTSLISTGWSDKTFKVHNFCTPTENQMFSIKKNWLENLYLAWFLVILFVLVALHFTPVSGWVSEWLRSCGVDQWYQATRAPVEARNTINNVQCKTTNTISSNKQLNNRNQPILPWFILYSSSANIS